MRSRRDYPATVVEVLDPTMRYRPATLHALREFKCQWAWSDDLKEQCTALSALNTALASVYDIAEPVLQFQGSDASTSTQSYYVPSARTIVLVGRLSVVTYLHEFAYALGYGERGACRWSINLFRRVWPRAFARCEQHCHMLVRSPS